VKLVNLSLFFILFSLLNCNKDADDKLLGPGIILSVDKPPDTWYHFRDFLKENNVKLTFYIENYPTLKDSTKAIMKEMQADGHEMAHHTNTHPHSDEYVVKYGMDTYIKEEINLVTDLMRNDGFNPITYAYPFGDCTTELDERLLEHFNSVRKIIDPYMTKHLSDMDQIYYRYGNMKLFYASSIDQRHHHSIDEILEALEMAKDSRRAVSLYCHFLNNNTPTEASNSHVYEHDMKRIILKAKELGLRFYTVSEVSRKKY
jgi:peptidoglycan/xylan/chitin deacetylase (PgdA/CDA1 family)